MFDILKDGLIDSIKLLPFLFIVYLIMEYIEHNSNKKVEKIVSKSGKFGPLIGSLMGAFPQCGFSVMASNLYVTRIISMGTLIGIYLSTSDEMLPIMISNGISFDKILKIVLLKVTVGILFGFIIDLFISKSKISPKKEINHICEHDHCHCEENIILSSIKHTLNIFIFIVLINVGVNILIYLIGEENISNIIVHNKLIGPILSGIVGLIPNCASSVVITELFINGTINFGSLITGLMVNSGVGMIVLFKLNKNYKENAIILILVYLLSIFTGIIVNFLNISI